MTEKLTPKAQAEQMLTTLLKGKTIHEIFAENMNKQLMVSGRPIPFWEEKFRINVPTDNLTPAICKELDMRIMDLHQEATFLNAVATAKAQMIKRGSEASFNSKFWTIVQEHKDAGGKLPAAATLERMAGIDNDEVESALTIADIECKFWKGILDHLSTCRKLVENASMNIATELKSLGPGQNYTRGGQ